MLFSHTKFCITKNSITFFSGFFLVLITNGSNIVSYNKLSRKRKTENKRRRMNALANEKNTPRKMRSSNGTQNSAFNASTSLSNFSICYAIKEVYLH